MVAFAKLLLPILLTECHRIKQFQKQNQLNGASVLLLLNKSGHIPGI